MEMVFQINYSCCFFSSIVLSLRFLTRVLCEDSLACCQTVVVTPHGGQKNIPVRNACKRGQINFSHSSRNKHHSSNKKHLEEHKTLDLAGQTDGNSISLQHSSTEYLGKRWHE